MKTKESFPTMNEIIFEKRNKLYGAYELRTRYPNRLFKSFIISNSVLVLLFLFSIEKKVEVPKDLIASVNEELFITPEIEVEQLQRELPKTVEPPPTPDEHSFIPVTDSVAHTDVDTTHVAESGNLASGNNSTGVGDSAVTTTGTLGSPGNLQGNQVRNTSSVDVIPEFPGGIEKFYSYLKNTIRCTEIMKREGGGGKMFVRFVVDEAGFVTDVRVVKKLGFGMDEQVTEVVSKSPRWKPGLVDTIKVKTEMILPFSFTIK